MINRTNYEYYMTDYIGGNLDPVLKAEFEAFLLVNPDIAEKTEDWETARLKPVKVRYPHKTKLKLLAAREEDMRLKPDLHIHYEKKALLYRKNPLIVYFHRGMAAAAILLLMLLFPLLQPSPEEKLRSFEPSARTVQKTAPLSLPAGSYLATAESSVAFSVSLIQRTPSLVKKESIPVVPQRELHAVRSAHTELVLSAPPVSCSTPEIELTEKAREWKTSTDNFRSRNILTSAIHFGKNLAEKRKKTEVSD